MSILKFKMQGSHVTIPKFIWPHILFFKARFMELVFLKIYFGKCWTTWRHLLICRELWHGLRVSKRWLGLTQRNRLDTRIQLNKVNHRLFFHQQHYEQERSIIIRRKKRLNKILKSYPLLSSFNNPALPSRYYSIRACLFSHFSH